MNSDPTNHDLHVMLTRVETKQDYMIEQQRGLVGHVAGLTNWRNRLVGAYMFMLVMGGAAAAYFQTKV